MSTRSSRRNAPVEFQQLSFQVGKYRKVKNEKKEEKNQPKIIQKEQLKASQFIPKHLPPSVENIEVKLNEEKKQQTERKEKNNQLRKTQNTSQIPTANPTQIIPNLRSKKPQVQASKDYQININPHHEIILQVIQQLITHEMFIHIDEARLRPTTNSQIRQMKQKLKGFYRIDQFKADIDKIFRIFYEQADAGSAIIESVKTMQQSIKEKINLQIQAFDDSFTDSQTQSASSIKSKKKKTKKKNGNQEKQKEKNPAKQSKVSIQSLINDESFQEETTPIQTKKIKKKVSAVTPRTKQSKLTQLQIAQLGYNIRHLPSEDLAVISFKYGETSQTKVGATVYYSLQLEKMPKEAFFQLQAFVKTTLRKRGLNYEQLNLEDDSDADFVIESDGQTSK